MEIYLQECNLRVQLPHANLVEVSVSHPEGGIWLLERLANSSVPVLQIDSPGPDDLSLLALGDLKVVKSLASFDSIGSLSNKVVVDQGENGLALELAPSGLVPGQLLVPLVVLEHLEHGVVSALWVLRVGEVGDLLEVGGDLLNGDRVVEVDSLGPLEPQLGEPASSDLE